ncbi:MAG: alpha-L-fucosidase [Brevinema sp.]
MVKFQNIPDFYGDTQWFADSRFGLFIHFGLYSVAARHEWIQTLEEINAESYQRYFDVFNPDLLDPADWAREAKKAGMKYVVITAKHHDGFSLWDTKHSDFKVTNTPYKKDLLKELIDAFRAEGLHIGVYYSLLDWHHPDFTLDGYHPDRNSPNQALESKKDMARYRKFMLDQLEELFTNYGKIDYLWFDFSYRDKDWGNYQGKGKDDWGSEDIEKLVLKLQPHVLLNDRLDLKRGVTTHEQYQRAKTGDNEELLWEGCQTLNGSWGYHRDNDQFKSPDMIVKMLIDTVSNNGNILINVGPNARGEWDSKSKAILSEVGEWVRLNARSIFSCKGSNIVAPADCRITQNKNRLYLHIFSWPYRTITLKNITKKVKFAQFLHDGSEVNIIEGRVLNQKRKAETNLNNEIKALHIKEKLEDTTIIIEIPVKKPQMLVPVIEIILED